MTDVFIYQEFAEPFGDPPAEVPPATIESSLPYGNLPEDLFSLDPSPDSTCVLPADPAIDPGPPELVWPREAMGDMTPEDEPNTIEDYTLPVFPSLPTPHHFLEVWQQKLEPPPEEEPLLATETLSDAALSVPAAPLDSWDVQDAEPPVDDPGVFYEGGMAAVSLEDFATPDLPPQAEGVVPDEEPWHLDPGLVALQLTEVVQAGDGWILDPPVPTPEEPESPATALVMPTVDLDDVPLDQWLPQAQLPPVEEEAGQEPVVTAPLIPVVTADEWFADAARPPDSWHADEYDTPVLTGDLVAVLEDSLLATPSLDFLPDSPRPPEDHEPLALWDIGWSVFVVSPPDARAYYIDAAGFYRPGSQAAGYAT